MKARGNTRKIISKVGEIQTLIGIAQSSVMNDRDRMSMDKTLPALEKAFMLCIEITGMYEPVEERSNKRVQTDRAHGAKSGSKSSASRSRQSRGG